MFGKKQTRWYIYTWVLFSTHVWILTHMYGKRHTCVKKATQLYVCKCLPFSTHVWEKPLTVCIFYGLDNSCAEDERNSVPLELKDVKSNKRVMSENL